MSLQTLTEKNSWHEVSDWFYTIGCFGLNNWMLWIPQCGNQTRGTRFLVRFSLHLFYWVVLRSPQLWNNQQHSFWWHQTGVAWIILNCELSNQVGNLAGIVVNQCNVSHHSCMYCTTSIDRNNFGTAWIIVNC